MEISLKAARTHNKVSQEETNSCSDLLYQFGYSRYSITQLKERMREREENGYKSIAISSWCLWFLNWVIPYSEASLRPLKQKFQVPQYFWENILNGIKLFWSTTLFMKLVIFFSCYIIPGFSCPLLTFLSP